MRGLVNIVLGGVMIVGGLSGQLVLRGTQNGIGLAVVGGGLVLLGVYRMAKRNS